MSDTPKPRRWRCKKCGKLNAADAAKCAERSCRRVKPRKRRRPTRAAEHRKLLADHRHLYAELLRIQDGHCALCPAEPKPGRKLDLDHDHKEMVIRGLLCVRCNRQLRSWLTPEWLEAAAKYLRNPPANQLVQE